VISTHCDGVRINAVHIMDLVEGTHCRQRRTVPKRYAEPLRLGREIVSAGIVSALILAGGVGTSYARITPARVACRPLA
jgi:hypothetical protein